MQPHTLASSWAQELTTLLGPSRLKNMSLVRNCGGQAGLGLMLTIRAYATYIASVLLFVAQLTSLPDNFEDYEKKTIRSLLPGPTAWISAATLHNLKELGFPMNFPSLRNMAIAARSRICRERDHVHRIHERAAQLRRDLDNCEDWIQLQWAAKWSGRSFIFHVAQGDNIVQRRLEECTRLNILPQRYIDWQLRSTSLISTPSRMCSWQAVATSLMHDGTQRHLRTHIERRLRTLPLITLPGRRIDKAVAYMRRLSKLVTPRVLAATLRTFCDGWRTHSRYQRSRPCRLFGLEDADNLAHIARCPRTWQWFEQHAKLSRPTLGSERDSFFCMSDGYDSFFCSLLLEVSSDDVVKTRGLAMYALYMVYNGARHQRHSSEEMPDAFKEYFRRGRLASLDDF